MKLAVVFPGIGYHTDKPLLYYSKKIAKEQEFDIINVEYGGFDLSIKGNDKKIKEAFLSALLQAEELLRDIDFTMYEKVLFISKSVGTAVAGAYAERHSLNTFNIFYTPVKQSFKVMKNPGVIFHGNEDPWFNHDLFLECVKKTKYEYYVIERGNHSLETGDVEADIDNMKCIMRRTKEYIKSI